MNENTYFYNKYINSITWDDSAISYSTIGNIRIGQRRCQECGTPIYNLALGDPKANDIADLLENDSGYKISETVAIDSRVLRYPRIVRWLNNQAKNHNVRIIDNNYKLKLEDYNKLKSFQCIFVDFVDESVNRIARPTQIVPQRGLLKIDTGYLTPVVDAKPSDNFASEKFEHSLVLHVEKNQLTSYKIKEIVNYANSMNHKTEIQFNFYSPELYGQIISLLQKYGLRKNIRLNFLGDPVIDDKRNFNNINNNPYDTIITYSTCKDVVDLYAKEPFGAQLFHYSQLEGSGTTHLNNYCALLNRLDEYVNHIKEKNYSPLEAAIYTKERIDDEYIYDPAAEFSLNYDKNTTLSNVSNSKILNGKRRAICVGFATLFSAVMRRSGINVFTYSKPGHMANIGRIKDPKYGIDKIGLFDITSDLLTTNGGRTSYYMFLTPPKGEMIDLNEKTSFLTIPHTLSLYLQDYCNCMLKSNDPVEKFFGPHTIPDIYDPLGWTWRMLELCGYNVGNDINSFYDTIYRLNANGTMDGIDSETLFKAIQNVHKAEGYSLNDREIKEEDAYYSLYDSVLHNLEPSTKYAILCNNDPNHITVEQVHPIKKEELTNLINDNKKITIKR